MRGVGRRASSRVGGADGGDRARRRPSGGRMSKGAAAMWIAIPCYDGAQTVGAIVRAAHAVSGLPVLVIDDGSTDHSAEVAEASGATVLRHQGNRGKGAALQTAFAFAEQQGATAVLSMDADGQHDPQ